MPRFKDFRNLVLGVGNRLFGDDGFGPCLIDRLTEIEPDLPQDTCFMDAGTAAARLLFDVLISERRPALLLIADAVDLPGHAPGKVFELSPAELPDNKRDDFSLHQLPGSGLLEELERGGCRVRIIACQVKSIPAEIAEGLSPEVEAALPTAEALVRQRIHQMD
jgi:coenzyme F420 hydrogenase subunit delta